MPWYRTIRNPNDEIKMLAIRSHITSDSDLQNQPFFKSTEKTLNHFTFVSSFQYLRNGTEQNIFTEFNGKENIGITVSPRTNNSRKVIWRKSNTCDVSDDIFKKSLSKVEFDQLLTKSDFSFKNESEIPKAVGTRFEKLKQECIKEKADLSGAKLPWTEGLFRYKIEEINGVVVNPENIQSLKKGIEFNRTVEQITGKKLDFLKFTSEGYIESTSMDLNTKALVKTFETHK